MNEIRIIPVEGIPEIKVDDNLAEITFDVLNKNGIGIEKNDIFIAVSYTHLTLPTICSV